MGRAAAETPSGVVPGHKNPPGPQRHDAEVPSGSRSITHDAGRPAGTGSRAAQQASVPAATSTLASTGSSGLTTGLGVAGAGLVGGGAAAVIIGHKALMVAAAATDPTAHHAIDLDQTDTQ